MNKRLPKLLKALLCVVVVLMVLVIVVGIWGYSKYIYTKPLTEGELAELSPNWSRVTDNSWSPWYTMPDGSVIWSPTKSFNAWLATIPEEETARPAILDALFAHEELFEHPDLGRAPAEADDWDGLVELLTRDEHREVVPDLLRALSMPVMGCGLYSSTDPALHAKLVEYGRGDPEWDPNWDSPSAGDPDLLSVLLPTLGEQRKVRRLLYSSAMIHIERGEINKALYIFEVAILSTHHALEYPSLIGHLVEISDRTLGFELLLGAMVDDPDAWTEAQLARVQALIGPGRTLPGAGAERTIVWESEMLMFHDLIRRFASPSGGVGYMNARQSLSNMGATTNNALPPAVSLPDDELKPVLQRPLYLYGQGFALMDGQSSIPWDDQGGGAFAYLMGESDSIHIIFKLLLEIMVPATDKAAARVREYNQQLQAWRLLVAAHRYRLGHGGFPETIGAIDNDLLPVAPVDAFSDEPLRYRLTDSGPMIYSVGTDRDDDGGRAMREYDLSLIENDRPVMSTWAVLERPIATTPHWLTRARVEAINAIDPKFIDGDWVLYPEPEEPEDD
tara:strand:+ start:218891 stop:220573 length:1683 start_codon:yes stop_codon:yes gene_type:complete